jgi:hypothetical protein
MAVSNLVSRLPLRVPEKFSELRPVFDLLRSAILERIETAANSGAENSVEWRFQESTSNDALARRAVTLSRRFDANLKELTFLTFR